MIVGAYVVKSIIEIESLLFHLHNSSTPFFKLKCPNNNYIWIKDEIISNKKNNIIFKVHKEEWKKLIHFSSKIFFTLRKRKNRKNQKKLIS